MAVRTAYEHIVLDENDRPTLAGTTTKVIEIVLDKLAYGWSPEEIHFQHPHLSLGQIHSALAYYWDHQAMFDALIEEQLEELERRRADTPPSPFVERLRRQGLLR